MHPTLHVIEGLRWCEAIEVWDVSRALPDLGLKARDSNLKELVEVARNDADVSKPLEQRNREVLGDTQHPLIEGKKAELPIDVTAIARLGGGRDGASGL